MRYNYKDITGKKFGKLTALNFAFKKDAQYFWLFSCECGKTKTINKSNVVRGLVCSCGCIKKDERKKSREDSISKMIGRKFGRLRVVCISHIDKNGNKYYKCFCSCGKKTTVLGKNLINGNTKSCGCFKKEIITSGAHKKHGLRKSRIYNIWSSMIKRTTNKKDASYKNYGGRGIVVCDEWKNSFISFYNWSIKNGYKDNLTIDRIDFNGNYFPENCRWSTRIEQARNKRNNHYLMFNGENRCISEWASIVGIKPSTISERIKRGWDVDKAIHTSPTPPFSIG